MLKKADLKRPHVLIFTDLDGTLLDHHSYSADPAAGLIQNLHSNFPIQVIPVTSKTRAELENMEGLSIFQRAPIIVENGSVLSNLKPLICGHTPSRNRLVLGMDYHQIIEKIAALPPAIRGHIRGFHDMSAEDVARETGLPLDVAVLAKQREATEPFLWDGSDQIFAKLSTIMADAGIVIQRGGRFFHFTGKASKVAAVKRLVKTYIDQGAPKSLATMALGDGPNDRDMIEAVDHGVIMPNPDGISIISDKDNVRMAPHPGPKGWVASVSEILDELGFNAAKI
ncbi:MAG: HAD-IIB family hydrolase [Parasphingorhabdus sp.]|uniref:HAD-IIB family hydrolase n=1 Tax=Parasphingorhabdus sp. TaxID=2709688 RepID=UPI003296A335